MRLIASILLAWCIGYYVGYHSHQNINELTRAGFVVIDPEGYQCERFDEGAYTVFHSYWTTTNKEN